jgi:hypothetical protein
MRAAEPGPGGQRALLARDIADTVLFPARAGYPAATCSTATPPG